MNNIILAINNNITADNLWNSFSLLIPAIGVVTLVGLGFYILKQQLKNLKHMN